LTWICPASVHDIFTLQQVVIQRRREIQIESVSTDGEGAALSVTLPKHRITLSTLGPARPPPARAWSLNRRQRKHPPAPLHRRRHAARPPAQPAPPPGRCESFPVATGNSRQRRASHASGVLASRLEQVNMYENTRRGLVLHTAAAGAKRLAPGAGEQVREHETRAVCCAHSSRRLEPIQASAPCPAS
jgi:hypothetical protein